MSTISKWVLLIGFFITPAFAFVVPDSFFFPFITGKGFAFRILVEVLLGFYLYLALVNPAYRPKKSWILWSVLSVFVVVLLSTFMGENPYHSFWSNSERMEGTITFIHLVTYFLMLISVLNKEKLWNWWWHTWLGSATAMAIFGLIQKYSDSVAINQGGVRIDGTFGNAIYMAVFMLFSIFLTFAVYAYNRAKEQNYGKYLLTMALIGANLLPILSLIRVFGFTADFVGKPSLIIAIILDVIIAVGWIAWAGMPRLVSWLGYGIPVIAYAFILVATATRGAMIGLIVGLIVMFAILALKGSSEKLKQFALAAGLVVVIGVAGFWLMRDSDFVKSSPSLNRFASLSLHDETVRTRMTMLGISWEGFKENPMLGVGPGNFNIVFNKNYDPWMYNQETWFDHAHNAPLDWLVTTGILGLLLYLSIFVAFLYLLWKEGRDVFSLPEKAIFTGLMVAYFTQNMTVFDNLFSYIMFFAVLAYIHVRVTEAKPETVKGNSNDFYLTKMHPAYAGTVAAAAFILAIFLVYSWNVKPIEANRLLIQLLLDKNTEVTEETLERAREMVDLDTFVNTEAREQVVMLSGILPRTRASDQLISDFAQFAVDEFGKQTERGSDIDARQQVFFGSFLRVYGQNEQAERHLKRALELSPRKQLILFELGAFYESIGNREQALEHFKQAFEAEKSYDQAAILYASSLIRAGEVKKAEEVLTEGVGTYKVRNNNIVNAYLAAGRIDRIVEIWEQSVVDEPNNFEFRVSLAAAYQAVGRLNEAINELNIAAKIDPGKAATVNGYIEKVRRGEIF